jgi:hypothetical protein
VVCQVQINAVVQAALRVPDPNVIFPGTDKQSQVRARLQSRARRKVISLMELMIGVYSELQPNGATSALRVRQRVEQAAAEGVVWPSTLFALLDDIIARSGRF